MAQAIHTFFQQRGFIYIHTPIITGSDCEGAGEMFRVTTLDLDHVPQKDGKADFEKDFFNQPAGLTVSGQLEAEIYALSMGDVYTFGPTFRAENSNTSRHLAEFWMVEPEMAFCDLEGNIDLAEDFLKFLFDDLLKNGPIHENCPSAHTPNRKGCSFVWFSWPMRGKYMSRMRYSESKLKRRFPLLTGMSFGICL